MYVWFNFKGFMGVNLLVRYIDCLFICFENILIGYIFLKFIVFRWGFFNLKVYGIICNVVFWIMFYWKLNDIEIGGFVFCIYFLGINVIL